MPKDFEREPLKRPWRAGNPRDWDESARIESEGHRFQQVSPPIDASHGDDDSELCGRCGNERRYHSDAGGTVHPIAGTLEVGRRWVARHHVVLEDVGVDRWYDFWFDPETSLFVFEECDKVCGSCEWWQQRVDPNHVGKCLQPNSLVYNKFTENHDGCSEWSGSERPPVNRTRLKLRLEVSGIGGDPR